MIDYNNFKDEFESLMQLIPVKEQILFVTRFNIIQRAIDVLNNNFPNLNFELKAAIDKNFRAIIIDTDSNTFTYMRDLSDDEHGMRLQFSHCIIDFRQYTENTALDLIIGKIFASVLGAPSYWFGNYVKTLTNSGYFNTLEDVYKSFNIKNHGEFDPDDNILLNEIQYSEDEDENTNENVDETTKKDKDAYSDIQNVILHNLKNGPVQ